MTELGARAADKADLVAGNTGDWEMVIGLEVHAQVTSKAKLFSGADASFGGAPNAHVSLVDAAMPGMLPVINQYCVEQAVRTGLGLGAKINLKSVFDRKNYFYPDLPQGYQISQFSQPIVGEGKVTLDIENRGQVEIGIERLHLEQDAGKSIHDQHASLSLVDLNRSGVALMEIVSKPDIRSPEEAHAYVFKLRGILRTLGTCDGNMEEGSLRADVNVSMRRPGGKLGTRAEIKNVNSLRFMVKAIEYEAQRQIDILEEGGKVVQETRLFDADSGKTRAMRTKEEAHDYRYFPDPDLLPLELEQSWIDEIKESLPELPDVKKTRFIEEYGLSDYDAGVLVAEPETAAYFEDMISGGAEPKAAANWLINEYFGRLNKQGLALSDGPVSPQANSEIVLMMASQEISSTGGKQILDILWNEGGTPRDIVDAHGLKQVSDSGELEKIVDDIIAANPDKAAEVKEKPKMLGWFVGQIMQKTGGKANPQAVNEILRNKLGVN